MGIYKVIESEITLTADDLAKRIVDNRLNFLEKFNKKKKAENKFLENHKYEVQEI